MPTNVTKKKKDRRSSLSFEGLVVRTALNLQLHCHKASGSVAALCSLFKNLPPLSAGTFRHVALEM